MTRRSRKRELLERVERLYCFTGRRLGGVRFGKEECWRRDKVRMLPVFMILLYGMEVLLRSAFKMRKSFGLGRGKEMALRYQRGRKR